MTTCHKKIQCSLLEDAELEGKRADFSFTSVHFKQSME